VAAQEGVSVQSDGPKNFIDPASREKVGPSPTEKPSGPPPSELRHEFHQIDLRDERGAERRRQDAKAKKAEHEATKAEHEARKTKHEATKARHEATKARHEANAEESTTKNAGKRSLTDLWRDWIFLGILVIATLTGIGAIVYGIATGTTRAMVTGVAVISGPSGTAVLGLVRRRPREDEKP